jgi:hypothetical protein
MKTLFDTMEWNAKETSGEIAGQCCVMTRAPHILFFKLARTKVFHSTLPAPSGILWWRPMDDDTLAELHQVCVRICRSDGFLVFCEMCRVPAATGLPFWREKLGDNFRYLCWRS